MNHDAGRGKPRSIDDVLEHARARLDRVEPAALGAELAGGALVVDIRPVDQRSRDGDLPGAMVIDRNVLEWRLDPACHHHIPEVSSYDLRIVIVCNEGYSSSLAAATLRDLGLLRATDMIGGYQAWLALNRRGCDILANLRLTG
ncbi:MAG: rhodanese-like domain-containing protein [Ilumatobacteraceae bacterium]